MTERMFFAPDEEAATRARKSLAQQTPATFSGIDILDGQIKTFAGIVQLVEDNGASVPVSKRWRIALRRG
jgi:hypothetical protein